MVHVLDGDREAPPASLPEPWVLGPGRVSTCCGPELWIQWCTGPPAGRFLLCTLAAHKTHTARVQLSGGGNPLASSIPPLHFCKLL